MTVRQNTNNPLGSNELADLSDNTLILDEFVNSQEDVTTDRFGNQFKTRHKILYDLEKAVEDVSSGNGFLPTTGGTITGSLNIDNNVNVSGGLNIKGISVDNKFLSLSGGVIKGNLDVVGTLQKNNIDVLTTAGGTVTGSLNVNGTLSNAGKRVLTEANLAKSYIIETYVSEDKKSWYRKYNDGFIEQSGRVTTSGGLYNTANLLTPFINDNNFSVVISNLASMTESRISNYVGGRTSKTQIRFASHTSGGSQVGEFMWYASGY